MSICSRCRSIVDTYKFSKVKWPLCLRYETTMYMSFEKVYLFTLPLYCRQFILLNILYSLHQKNFALIQHLQEKKRD